MLRVAVHVERAVTLEIVFAIIHAGRPISVGRSRGGVDEATVTPQSPLSKAAGEFIVVLDEILAVFLGGGGAGPEVEDRAHIRKQGTGQGLKKAVRFKVVGETERQEVLPLFIRPEKVRDDNVVPPLLVQGPHQGATNEPCASCYEDWTFGEIHTEKEQ